MTSTDLVVALCMLELLPPSIVVGVGPWPSPHPLPHCPTRQPDPPSPRPTYPTHPARLQVNKKVMQMFEKAEQEYNELKRKKDVVEGDKSRIQQVRGLGRGGAHSSCRHHGSGTGVISTLCKHSLP